MPRRRNEDDTTLYWSQKQKEELLVRLAAYNQAYHGKKPDAKTWEEWAKGLQEHFNDPVTPAKVQQMMRRLKGKFEKELALRTNTGLGWDPVACTVTCTAEYWLDFAKNKKWANGARDKPLTNWDLYYEAFGSTRATGAFEKGMEKTPTEHDNSTPVADDDNEEGATSQSLGSDDGFVTTMRAGLNTTTRGLNIASASKAIGKKPVRSCRRQCGDPEAKALIGRLVDSIESKNSSRGTSSGTNQRFTNPLMRDCHVIVKQMDLDDETAVTFLEAIGWYPHMQQIFVDLTETQRGFFVTKTINAKSNTSAPAFSVPNTGMPSNFMQPPFPNYMSPVTNFQAQSPFFGQAPPNFGQVPPNFGQHAPNFGQQVPNNFPHSPNLNTQPPPYQNMSQNFTPPTQPPYYVPHFPPTSGPFGGDGNEE